MSFANLTAVVSWKLNKVYRMLAVVAATVVVRLEWGVSVILKGLRTRVSTRHILYMDTRACAPRVLPDATNIARDPRSP